MRKTDIKKLIFTVTTMCAFGSFAFASPSYAYYNDTEATDNTMQMTSVDFELGESLVVDRPYVKQTIHIENKGATDPEMDASLSGIFANTNEFCEKLFLSAQQKGKRLFEGPLLSFSFSNIQYNQTDFDFIVNIMDGEEIDEEGDGLCQVEYRFVGRIPGFPDDTGFLDTEKIPSFIYAENNESGENPLYPEPALSEADQCKNGGWELFIEEPYNLPFENQGHCVSHFASEGQSTEARAPQAVSEAEPEVLGTSTESALEEVSTSTPETTKQDDEEQLPEGETLEDNPIAPREESDDAELKEKAKEPEPGEPKIKKDDEEKVKKEKESTSVQDSGETRKEENPEPEEKVVGLEIKEVKKEEQKESTPEPKVEEPETKEAPQKEVVGLEISAE